MLCPLGQSRKGPSRFLGVQISKASTYDAMVVLVPMIWVTFTSVKTTDAVRYSTYWFWSNICCYQHVLGILLCLLQQDNAKPDSACVTKARLYSEYYCRSAVQTNLPLKMCGSLYEAQNGDPRMLSN